MRTRRFSRSGFTLIELSVLLVILGVLCALAVPRFMATVERDRAGEAFHYLTAVMNAQREYQRQHGHFSAALSKLDLDVRPLRYFRAGRLQAQASPGASWSLTLCRIDAMPGYGAYTVTFNQGGYDAKNSTIDAHPEINPVVPASQLR